MRAELGSDLGRLGPSRATYGEPGTSQVHRQCCAPVKSAFGLVLAHRDIGPAEACSPADMGSAETTNRRESLCLNVYLMNHWSRSSIRVCLAGVASMVGCRAEMTTNTRWRPSVTEWPQAWRITRLTTCRQRQTLRRQEFPKQSIWRSEGCWTTPQSTRRTADSAVLRFSTVVTETYTPGSWVAAAAEPGFGVAVSRVGGR